MRVRMFIVYECGMCGSLFRDEVKARVCCMRSCARCGGLSHPDAVTCGICSKEFK